MTKETILLVEDNISDIELTKRAFAKACVPNQLIVAENGQEALDFLFQRAREDSINLSYLPAMVLLDLKLPGMDGLEVLKTIRNTSPIKQLPIIILSSSKEACDITNCYNYGANSYICKPIDFNQFIETMQQVCKYWLTINQNPNRN